MRRLLLASLLLAACHPAAPAQPPPAASPSGPSAPVSDEDALAAREMLDAQIHLTTSLAHGLRLGAALWQASRESCPTPEDVIQAGLLSPHLRARDAWDTPYRITCEGKAPTVRSAGPDRTFGTADDIVADDR
jgi:hypothetical protein